MKRSKTASSALLFLAIGWILSPRFALGENWPQWRGPRGDGVSGERELPIAWTTASGIAWKTKLPAWGTSTPAIWGDAIFLTTHREEEKSLELLRLDKKTGAIQWTRKVGEGAAPRKAAKRGAQKFHDLHNLASPSPVTDGKHVVVHFGNGDLAVYDFEGKQLWLRNLQTDHGTYTIWWGHANSPVIHQGLVISVCMQDSLADLGDKLAPSYLVAHDVETGKVRWTTGRMTRSKGEEGDSYTTPLLYSADDRVQVIVMGGNQLDGYDAETGRQLWYLPDLAGGRTVTGPTIAGDRVFCTRGRRGSQLAVKLGGSGKLTARDVAWQYSGGSPDACTPVVWKDLLFTITDEGVARCFETSNGALKWNKRLEGDYKASPVAADGRVYFLNTAGRCTVVSATRHFDKLTENQIDDATLASPAISAGRIYIRGKDRLWCVRK